MNSPFNNPLGRRSPNLVAKAGEIKAWIRELLALPEDAVVSVNELSCSLPDCPPKETVVLVMHDGETSQVSLHMAMEDVTRATLAGAL
ncbi:hypothetical protein ACQKKX_05780 [Neorhizobium sp. NPDC001467]|uniref:hypothetical protein n=1 Tax=Neorhizobium sp. NPDC001467 TaxID=3390595 RepID=UPI003CFEFD84